MSKTTFKNSDLDVINAYNGLAKITVISESAGVSPSQVMSIVKRARQEGLISRPPRQKSTSNTNGERDSAIAVAYAEGQTLEQIGSQYNITRERVRQILAAQNVRRHTPGSRAALTKETFMNENGQAIDEAFDRLRSVRLVIDELKGTPAGVAAWITDRLKERKNESIVWNSAEKVWSNDQLLDVLRKAHGDIGDGMSASGYNKWRMSSSTTSYPTHTMISWRFNTWNEALKEAGLPVNQPNRTYSRTWTVDDVFAAVANYMAEERLRNTRPTFSGYEAYAKQRKGEVPSGAYIRCLTGLSWSEIAYRTMAAS